MKISIKILILSLLFISVSCLKEDDGIIVIAPTGDTLNPEVGGPNQPNQIWVDLSTREMKGTNRTSWDLGLYSGDQFAVILNTAALMSASPVEGFTELNQVNSQNQAALMQMVQVANFDPNNIYYIDDVAGNYLDNGGTVIDEENKIYLINLGFEIPEGPFNAGSSYAAGALRGWKKIKISSETNGYTIQYAGLDDTNIQEAFVPKDSNYNFSFFSLVTGSIMDIQPPKTDWDICFTVFVNEVADNSGNSQGSYIYTDFVLSNTMAETGVYEIITNEATLIDDYNNFTAADVVESSFIYDDHRAIGANWRTVPGAIVRNNRFYVLKDPDGLLFKIRFISMSDANGYRGYPVFEYEPL